MAQTLDGPEGYSVAWIAALSIERAAATALLDERHDTPTTFEQHQHDGNSYTWGRMGKHNIVIASLPAGVYGTNAAATTVTHLLSSLPHIKIGLLVGIGGGVPQDDEDADIRLGDVVVSQPGGTSGGVIQYDLVKAKAGDTWERKGALNKPPRILLSSLSKIQAEHEISPSRVPEILEEMWKSNPQMKTGKKKAPAYVHQGFENDRLFQPDYDHVGGSTCVSCIGAEEVQRESRESTDPEIHYGLIASGNTLVKDAKERDWILNNVAPGCICFEMEAAGLMDSFPCLVIRGICDYADSHKNDKWQRYAAATAAAFGKEFLAFVPVPDLGKSPGAVDLISSVGQKIEQKVEDLKSRIVDAEHKRILDALPVAEDALFDSEAEAHRPTCFENTRVELLEDIMDWAGNAHARSRVFWLRGIAGTGKSTISRSVARRLKDRGSLGATFFFKRGWGDCGTSSKLVTTLARQLASRDRAVAMSIRDVVDQELKISSKSLDEQFDKLIVDPLSKVADAPGQSLVIVIDALDECDFGDEAIKKARRILGLFRRAKHLNFKIFITSRPEVPVKVGFELLRGIFEELVLHEIPKAVIKHDIAVFLKRELGLIRQNYNDRVDLARQLPDNWPGKYVERLAEMAFPLFIFAATMCRLIGEQRVSGPQGQISLVLESHPDASSNMDATYLPVMHQLTSGLSKLQERQVMARFAEIVAPIVVLASPLSPIGLSRLLDVPLNTIDDHLDLLQSVLRTPEDSYSDIPIELYHQSFRDFVVDPEKQLDTQKYPFWVNEKQTHSNLAEKCVGLLSRPGVLKKNVCHLDSLGTRRAELSSEHISTYLPAEVQYACRYWTFHYEMSCLTICDGNIVEGFLAKHVLHWIEALAILGLASEIAGMVQSLENLLESTSVPWLRSLLVDLRRLLMQNWAILDEAPLQLYASALVFAPKQSLVRKYFSGEMIPLQLYLDVDDDWDACSATLEHGDMVTSIAVSFNSHILASCSLGRYIKLWDTSTGVNIATIEPRADGVFSGVVSLAFSPDPTNRVLASGSIVGDVEFWDAETCERISSIKEESSVEEIRFSPDASKVAIFYREGREGVKIYDTSQYACIWTLWGPDCPRISAIGFSHDSLQLVSLSGHDKTTRFWNSDTGACLATLHVDVDRLSQIALARRSNLLALTLRSEIVLWDAEAKESTATLKGHEDTVHSIDFSDDSSTLVSGSNDNTIRLWNTALGTCLATLSCPDATFTRVVSLGDGNKVASIQDEIITLWDTALTQGEETCRPGVPRKPDLQTPRPRITLSLASSAFGEEVLAYDTATFGAWDPESGVCKWTMREPGGGTIRQVQLSPDGSRIVTVPKYGKRRVFDGQKTSCMATLDRNEHSFSSGSVAFSHDGKSIATIRRCGQLKLWDLDSGEWMMQQLKNDSVWKYPVIAFSPDSSLLVSARPIIQLWETGTLSCTLELGQIDAKGNPSSAAFSSDSSLLAVGWTKGDVTLWDTHSGSGTAVLKGHYGKVRAVAFIYNSARVASSSEDKNVRLWDTSTATCIAILDCFTTNLCFNSLNDTLHTDRGYYVLNGSQADAGSGTNNEVWHQIMGINQDLDWIRWQGKDAIWMPPKYRPAHRYRSDQSVKCIGSTMVVATSSGRLMFLKIREKDISVDGLW